eukprot:184489-Chlamydomonas_euryale.AAC.1
MQTLVHSLGLIGMLRLSRTRKLLHGLSAQATVLLPAARPPSQPPSHSEIIDRFMGQAPNRCPQMCAFDSLGSNSVAERAPAERDAVRHPAECGGATARARRAPLRARHRRARARRQHARGTDIRVCDADMRVRGV